MKTLADLLRNPNEFFKDKRRMRILIVVLFAIVFTCIIALMFRTAVRSKSADNTETTVTLVVTLASTNIPAPTTPDNTPTA
jgi:uncharacterized membrane protein YkvI